jgi:hypothetical protein
VNEPAATTRGTLRDRLSRPERLLPLACLLGAACLFASELMTMFEFTPPGAEALCTQGAGDRHGNAMFVISAFAVGALAVALFAPSKPAAIAVAAMGGVALLVFLLTDLPDAGQLGTINDSCGPVRQSFFDAEAVPQAGFWMELVGALALAVSGTALATLSREQLGSLRPGAGSPPAEPPATTLESPSPAPVASANPGPAGSDNGPTGEPARARRR